MQVHDLAPARRDIVTRAYAAVLDDLGDTIAQLYADRTGGSSATWRARMRTGNGAGHGSTPARRSPSGLADVLENDRQSSIDRHAPRSSSRPIAGTSGRTSGAWHWCREESRWTNEWPRYWSRRRRGPGYRRDILRIHGADQNDLNGCRAPSSTPVAGTAAARPVAVRRVTSAVRRLHAGVPRRRGPRCRGGRGRWPPQHDSSPLSRRHVRRRSVRGRQRSPSATG